MTRWKNASFFIRELGFSVGKAPLKGEACQNDKLKFELQKAKAAFN